MFTELFYEVVHRSLQAHGRLKVSNNKFLHGMLECTGDLSNVDCMKCIDTAISELWDHSYRKGGGSIIYGSCYIRFELHFFY